jgi:hypothetical protein
MNYRKKVARRNRYFTSNAGNESGNFATFTAWKKREKATYKEAMWEHNEYKCKID